MCIVGTVKKKENKMYDRTIVLSEYALVEYDTETLVPPMYTPVLNESLCVSIDSGEFQLYRPIDSDIYDSCTSTKIPSFMCTMQRAVVGHMRTMSHGTATSLSR